MRQPSKPELLRRMKARMRRMIVEVEDMIRTVEAWNRLRTDAPPMDCEVERVALPVMRQSLEQLERGIADETLSRRLIEIYAGEEP